jgi:tRNA threonylcarbamoyladenosine biosynthesis protein TsaE
MMKKKNLEWLNCSEEQLKSHIREWIRTQPSGFKNTIVFLEGEMGAGKSTFARLLLSELVDGFSSQGSPTFPLVQEYRARANFPIYHIDLYRLKNESELEDSGILHQIEEPGALALVEWPNLFADTFSYWKDASKKHQKTVLEIEIQSSSSDENSSTDLRNYQIKN